jgi:hypothetical protein
MTTQLRFLGAWATRFARGADPSSRVSDNPGTGSPDRSRRRTICVSHGAWDHPGTPPIARRTGAPASPARTWRKLVAEGVPVAVRNDLGRLLRDQRDRGKTGGVPPLDELELPDGLSSPVRPRVPGGDRPGVRIYHFGDSAPRRHAPHRRLYRPTVAPGAPRPTACPTTRVLDRCSPGDDAGRGGSPPSSSARYAVATHHASGTRDRRVPSPDCRARHDRPSDRSRRRSARSSDRTRAR